MPQFDMEKMNGLVAEMRKSVGQLADLAKVDDSDFLSDPHKIGNAKYQFIVAIEACIDMGNHIISRNGYRIPQDYADTFKVLGEIGAIDSDFVDELRAMAKFRNRLVHIYWEVDDRQLYEILQLRLGDFKKFLDYVGSFLDWKNIG
ncbi:MAG: DUF86 domain-containing protein [Desulfoferrobacter sp.]